jgi:hypothetical protein
MSYKCPQAIDFSGRVFENILIAHEIASKSPRDLPHFDDIEKPKQGTPFDGPRIPFQKGFGNLKRIPEDEDAIDGIGNDQLPKRHREAASWIFETPLGFPEILLDD